MGTREKLIERFKTKPKDFTFDETVRLFGCFGYLIDNKGATSGSRVRFHNEETQSFYDMHKPHPGNIIKESALKNIYVYLNEKGLI